MLSYDLGLHCTTISGYDDIISHSDELIRRSDDIISRSDDIQSRSDDLISRSDDIKMINTIKNMTGYFWFLFSSLCVLSLACISCSQQFTTGSTV